MASESRKQASRHQLFAMRHLLTTMAQPSTTQLPYNEGDILLAISSIDTTRIPSARRATVMFNVPKATLRDRRARKPIRRDCEPNLKKLTKLKEEVIVRHILDLNPRGFAPTLGTIQDIADKLLAKRSAS